MPTANIILIILAIIAVVCIGILAATHFAAAKRKKELPREIGVVSVVMTSRVPGGNSTKCPLCATAGQ